MSTQPATRTSEAADRPRVLVSGGGIGGNAVALQLLRHGIPVTVIERAAAPRPGGQAVDLRGPSREVAERMGLMPGIRAHQLDERGMLHVDADGKELLRMPADMFDGKGGVAEIEITRGDLNQVLLDAIDAAGGCDYRYGEWIETLAQDDDGAQVTFASGATEGFDLVIGADGLHSATRRLVFGPEEQFSTYLGGYMSFFTMPTPAGIEPHWFTMHSLPGATGLGMRPDADPATAKALVVIRAEADPALRRNVQAQQQLICERLAGGGWTAPAIAAAMSEADDFYFDELARIDMPSWIEGRVALLGDAGYCGSPLTGQGTAMALVGAYVLAGEIAAHRDDPRRALENYQRVLRPFVALAQELQPGGLRAMTPKTRFGIRAGLLVSKLMTARIMKPLMMKMLSKTESYNLPEYPATTPAR
ncbi:FAD-dependent monooxygenase [Nocardia cyriacigeorgica]|uniref:FAD-dependent monooxygenase n=1 Tax=Nocardia cyriacigeorgica TaxID=135487 RepID=UPI000CE9F865|nr:FAD-dependent monooxygenase [Nocardia cyriacigeorgica]AVH21234.1 FAD-binding monooxygenase [Nocardia cyriacigeorgica]MBF6499664.1 FAD-dependent monooxygenase [Nocardia cyriacigeorgica]PPJ00204.1 FAD-binding monooxygenase [Nocardia cyriacigeorgica]